MQTCNRIRFIYYFKSANKFLQITDKYFNFTESNFLYTEC
jgi:hypothetical protein